MISFQEDDEKLDSSENLKQTCLIDDNCEENKPPESAESQMATEEAGCVELAEKDTVKINATEDKKQNVCKSLIF